jgi:hypothetical protein
VISRFTSLEHDRPCVALLPITQLYVVHAPGLGTDVQYHAVLRELEGSALYQLTGVVVYAKHKVLRGLQTLGQFQCADAVVGVGEDVQGLRATSGKRLHACEPGERIEVGDEDGWPTTSKMLRCDGGIQEVEDGVIRARNIDTIVSCHHGAEAVHNSTIIPRGSADPCCIKFHQESRSARVRMEYSTAYGQALPEGALQVDIAGIVGVELLPEVDGVVGI